jgi:hypothetical protein
VFLVNPENAANKNDVNEKQIIELKERLSNINKRLLTLEWDKKHNQLNAGMEEKYAELKAEHDKLVAEINED